MKMSTGGVVRITAGVMVFIHLGLILYGATKHSPSLDEVGHLAAGVSHWRSGCFTLYCVNPPLVRLIATAPVVCMETRNEWEERAILSGNRPEFNCGARLIEMHGSRAFSFFTIARWACAPFSCLGAYICFRWARDLYGPAAGLMSVVLWCFSPNILAHAQMITPDLGATALGVLTCYMFWRWLRARSWEGAYAAGLTLGLAQLCKTTFILLYALWPAVWLWWCLSRTGNGVREVKQLVMMLALSLFVINLGYGFEGTLLPLKSYRFLSRALSGHNATAAPGPSTQNRFADIAVGRLPVPLPANYVLGIDHQKRDFEIGLRSYLGGRWKHRGWWYYYLYALAVKVPLGTWGILGLGLVVTSASMLRNHARLDVLTLLGPPLLIVVFVSSQTGFNHHLRYVLPAFPFAFIFCGAAAHDVIRRGTGLKVLAGGALAWSVLSSLCCYPHCLSYFNELAGGPIHGHNHLVDSNIDWGQDILYLKDWVDLHPEASPLRLACFSMFDPTAAGVNFTAPNPLRASFDGRKLIPEDELGPSPGWYAVSVSVLRGLEFPLYDGRGGRISSGDGAFTYFQHFEPVARAGYSIYIYHITLDEANRVRRGLGLPELLGDLPAGGASEREDTLP